MIPKTFIFTNEMDNKLKNLASDLKKTKSDVLEYLILNAESNVIAINLYEKQKRNKTTK